MERNYVKKLIGNQRYKLAPNTNTDLQLQLTERSKPLSENNLIDIVNLQNLFEEERGRTTKYRFNGKLNIYTSNVLSSGATDSMWDPLFDGAPPTIPNNWLMQITYPSQMDSNYLINARTPLGTVSSNAFRGLQYKSLGLTVINNDNKLTVSGIQKHNLVPGDYIYLYSNSNYNSLQGIHKIENVGINGNLLNTDLTLETITNVAPLGFGNFVRIVDPSFNDINFNGASNFNIAIATDINGGVSGSYVPGETIYTTIYTTSPHNLLVNDFVDIRTGNVSTLNGTWRVYNVIGGSGSTKFVIKATISPTKGFINGFPTPLPKWRRLDGTPSEYYIRKFEVLTSNQYDVYPCAFSSTIYSDVSDYTVGTMNKTWMFQFNQDVDIERIRDNRNGPISEMYYTIMKRSGKYTYNWSTVTADWDFNYETSNTSNGLELISVNKPSGVGTIEKYSARTETINTNGDIVAKQGSLYIGDFIDYNSKEIKERTVSEVIHRFGIQTNPNGEGYYYKPFKKLQVRKYSDIIETAEPNEIVIDIPGNYVTYSDGSYSWRDLLTIGYFEEGVNGVEYPFVNGSHYFYFNHNLYVRRQNPPIIITQDDARAITSFEEEC